MKRLLSALACFGCSHAGAPPAATEPPVVQVVTAAVERGVLVDNVTAYGTIVPAPGSAITITRPFEVRVARLLVTPGQRVSAKDPVIRFEPSADTRLRVDVARKANDAAVHNLDNVQHRFQLGLATNADVLAAQQALEQSSAELQSLQARGAGSGGTIDAPRAGVVSQVHVQEGALVAPGQPLVDIVADSSIEAQLGVELARADRIHPGDPVHVTSVARPGVAADGTVRSVARSVAPDTRLIPVMVTLSGDLLLGEYVEARFPVAKHDGLTVPRSAVLPDSDLQVLFTVESGRAKRHVVRVGSEAGGRIEIVSPEIHAGDRVIVVGNYGCADGARVREITR